MKLLQGMLVCLVVAFSGCAHVPDYFAGASPNALTGLAEHAADLLAEEYPPGHTTLDLTSRPSGEFAESLETSLRRRGFSLAAAGSGHPGLLAVDTVMEPVGEGDTWYLHIRAADGFSVGQVFRLTEGGFAPQGAMTRTERSITLPENTALLPETSVAPPKEKTAGVDEWRIEPGSLQPQLSKWCSRENYRLIWKAENDYVMEASAIFRDNFVSAAQRLFTRMHQSGHGLRVRIYPDNRVLEVMED